MPPKRKTAATPTAIATAGTSTTSNPPVRRRGRPPTRRNNEGDANINDDDDNNEPQAKRPRIEDATATQDSDPQSLSEKTHDVVGTSCNQDISKDHTEAAFFSDPGEKEEHQLSHIQQQHPEMDVEEEDGEFSTGLRRETSESLAKKTRGMVSRRGKGVLPATRSSPRKQARAQLQTRQQDEEQIEEETAIKPSLQFSPPSTITTTLSTQLPQTTSAQLQRVKRRRGRPPKVTTRVVDPQSLPDQPAVTADETEERSTAIVFPIATAPGTDQITSPIDNGGGCGGGSTDDRQPPTAIVPSQVVSSQPVANAATLDDIAQQQEIPRLPSSPEHHHHQATASHGLDVPTHPHPHPHVHSHPHPSSLYPPMQYAYTYPPPPHHGAPSHYPFAHPPPPPPAAHPYPSSASQSGIEYSPSFASTVSTTTGGSFTNAYPHHPDPTTTPAHAHAHPHPHPHPHAHAILDPNAPHGNPFPPSGSMSVSNYNPGVYVVPPPISSSPALTVDPDEHKRNETQLGLASTIAVNGGAKRKVIPVASGSKAGGRAGRGDHVACHFCRGRKLKCDGRRPTCGHCSLRSLACAYDDFIRRRGPGKKEKNSKRNLKSQHSSPDAEGHDQTLDQNMMLLGPDIAGVEGEQSDVLVALPSQSQPNPIPIPSSSSISPSTVPSPSMQRRRRRNAPNNAGSAGQSGTSILRFDTAGSAEGSSASILSGLKPSAVAYAIETNERLPVNVSMPSVGMEYYTYHPHPHPQQPPAAGQEQQHQHHLHHEHHHHLAMPYAQEGQSMEYYAQPHHPTADPGQANAHDGYEGERDEDVEEDAEGDAEGSNVESPRPPQHGQYDPHSHHAYAHTHAPAPPPWPPEPPGAHARV